MLITDVEYEYREGESVEKPTQGFEFIEAITTLACAGPDISHVAMAKGYVGGLYADINSAPYKVFFNPGTSSIRLWNLVKLTRQIEQSVRESHDVDSPVERGIVVHGNRLLTHMALRRIGKSAEQATYSNVDPGQINTAVVATITAMKSVIEAHYQDAYLAPLFKNVGKCSDVRAKAEALLP